MVAPRGRETPTTMKKTLWVVYEMGAGKDQGRHVVCEQSEWDALWRLIEIVVDQLLPAGYPRLPAKCTGSQHRVAAIGPGNPGWEPPSAASGGGWTFPIAPPE